MLLFIFIIPPIREIPYIIKLRMQIIIKNILYILIIFIFLLQVIEDLRHKEIYLYLTFLEIFLLLLIDLAYFKLIIIYVFISSVYFLFRRFFTEHMGFGDIWYMLFYFYNFTYVSLLNKVFYLYGGLIIFLIINYIYEKKIPKRIAFLPIIAIGYLLILIGVKFKIGLMFDI